MFTNKEGKKGKNKNGQSKLMKIALESHLTFLLSSYEMHLFSFVLNATDDTKLRATPVQEVELVATIAADYISAPPSFPDIALNTNLAKLFCSNATELHDEPVAVSPATHDRQITFRHQTEIMTGRGGGGGRRVLLPPM